ncbi:MAG: LytTR family DNA-binding domain-containing protein, partial [Bacteroidota bacterium]
MRTNIIYSPVSRGIASALLFGAWIFLFLVVIAPFDIKEVSFKNRLLMMPGYSALLMLFYLLVYLREDRRLNEFKSSNLRKEFRLFTLLFILLLPPTFFYYKSAHIQGESSFYEYLGDIYLPFWSLAGPFLLLIRLINTRLATRSVKDHVVLGTDKFGKIVVPASELLYIKAADNYLQLHQLLGDRLVVKLVRSTLIQAKELIPDFIQTHRSYLVNPDHIVSWKNAKTLYLTESEVPVAKNRKKAIPDLEKIRP